jgi:hypothetical protein
LTINTLSALIVDVRWVRIPAVAGSEVKATMPAASQASMDDFDNRSPFLYGVS